MHQMVAAPAVLSVFVAVTLCSRALAAEASAPRSIAAPTEIVRTQVEPSTARRRIDLNGTPIDYTVRWSELVLNDSFGEPQATISSTSYVREDVADRLRRPVIVFFNGGPGASSSPLHFDAFGPRRRAPKGSPADAPLIDNPATPLDVADLLFVDPVGTGFSRELRDGGGRAYWGTRGDPESVLKLVRSWLRENGRSNSPVIVIGQSYGGTRAALMAKDMTDLNVAALVLVSPALDYSATASVPGNDYPFVFTLPTMAVAAWYHGKAARDGSGEADAGEVWARAREFAQGEFLQALALGSRLGIEEKSRLALRISKLTGLPVDKILKSDLRIDSQEFLETLLDDQRLVVGRLDTRVTAPVKPPLNPDRPAAANDPSLGLGRDNVIRSPSITRYYRDEVGVRTEREYFSLTLDVNFNWNWNELMGSNDRGPRFWFTTTPNLEKLLREKPNARLLVVGGYFDLATPLLGVEHAITHARLPNDRVEVLALPGSHSPYDDPRNLETVAERLRALARGATTAPLLSDRRKTGEDPAQVRPESKDLRTWRGRRRST